VRVFRLKITLSRMPLVPTSARLKILHACDQWHSSRVFTPLIGSHCKFRQNTKGTRMEGTWCLNLWTAKVVC
jgi:hypothetical protein